MPTQCRFPGRTSAVVVWWEMVPLAGSEAQWERVVRILRPELAATVKVGTMARVEQTAVAATERVTTVVEEERRGGRKGEAGTLEAAQAAEVGVGSEEAGWGLEWEYKRGHQGSRSQSRTLTE